MLSGTSTGTAEVESQGSSTLEEKDISLSSTPNPSSSPASSSNSLSQATVLKTTYLSPYDAEQPLDYIIIHNRSKNAANYAIRQLKDAWPDIKIIHVVQGDRERIPYADEVIRINNWTSMSHFKDQFEQLAHEKPELRRSMKAGKVGFYCVWSAAAENSHWAEAAQEAGFRWIGASPNRMKGLDKIEYKKLCQSLGLPTADFIEIQAPEAIPNKEDAFKAMAQKLLELYAKTPALAGKAVFAKHNEGGGGRGTKKIAEMTPENALEAIRKIVNETGGNLDGVYVEQALDLEGAQLFQIEIEGDAGTVAYGGRLVWFNKENQKVLEDGFTDEAILEMIPKEIYEACRAASEKVFKASGYDSRGTNEILIIRDKDGQWSFKLLELNKRIQVENEALSELITDLKGRPRNVPAEQVMRSLGYPPPSEADFRKKGPAIVAHIRLLSCEITPNGSIYPLGLDIEGAIHPQGANVQYAKGPVYLDADPQIGRALITAPNWKAFCYKLLQFAQNFQFYGPKTELSTYFDFFRKLAADSVFQAGRLGCNHTFNVLNQPPVAKGKPQQIAEALASTVTPLVTHGYRPGEGIKDQPYPTPSQLKEFTEFMDSLRYEKVPETPFSRFLKHNHYLTYIKELKDQLARHGGGTVTVIRDVLQSSGDQESALVQKASVRLAEVLFARSGIGIGFETGGAQYQAGLMRNFDWMAVLLAGCPANLPSHSLTRSKWLNGLTPKTLAEQAFVLQTISREVAQHYGFAPELSPDQAPFIPWMPYNFHAGNHPEQDLTTQEMLRANLAVIPSWAWDPRYTEEQFLGWVKRQIELFQQEKKPLCQIRIKNPGQGPAWTSTVIVALVQNIRQMFHAHKLDEPIILIHNHEFNGKAAHIAAKAFKKCQELGYRYLIIDSAPPGTSHNSNLVLAEALTMTEEEKDALMQYNHGAQLLLNLTNRFNNQNITKEFQDPNSEMAGGTGSSDLADALKMRIPLHKMEKLKAIAKELTGLGTPVTPYSEWIKQIGFAIWTNDLIQPKTLEATETYIKKGGQLTIATPILEGLQAWKTLLPRKPIVAQLLINHGMAPEVQKKEEEALVVFNSEARRTELQALLPNTRITDRVLSTVIAFDVIGFRYLKHRDQWVLANGPRDLTLMMESPAFVHSQTKNVGDSFYLFGEKVTLSKLQLDPKQGLIYVDFSFQGHTLRFAGQDPNKLSLAAIKQKQFVQDKNTQLGAPMAGSVIRFFVKPGDVVKKGQELAVMEAMKMENTLRSQDDLVVDTVKTFDGTDKTVDRDEVLITFKKP